MKHEYFPSRPDSNPQIYAYEDSNPLYKGLLKVGYTANDVEVRVAQQYPTKRPGPLPYKIVLCESAIRDDGSTFTDHAVHAYLRRHGFENPEGEWFRCTVKDVKAAMVTEDTELAIGEVRTEIDKIPHFLWNAKMRFGKTFASYQLAKRMGFTKILVLTFKPAVQSAWKEDLMSHVDFEGWQFISRKDLSYEDIDKTRPFVCFASFQDYLGKADGGGIKLKNKWAHEIHWDLVIFDEYHYGAWRDKAKDLFESEESKEQKFLEGEGMDLFKEGFDEDLLPISTSYYLYLSGTPFRAIASGEFIEEQIYNWTYSDEQRAKENWVGGDNPYEMLPRVGTSILRSPRVTSMIT